MFNIYSQSVRLWLIIHVPSLNNIHVTRYALNYVDLVIIIGSKYWGSNEK